MPKKRKETKKVVVYDSDDENAYKGEEQPDPNSDNYYMDDVDEFHAKRDKVLLEKGIPNDDSVVSDSEEELMGLVDSDDESDDEIRNYKSQLRNLKRLKNKDAMGSDFEDEDEESGLPDAKAWGKKRSEYYGADVDDEDLDLSGSEDEEAAAVLEEKEALALQKKMAAELDDQDFDLDIFKKSKPAESKEKEETEEKIIKDLSKLSKREKLKLVQKESPELLTLIEDFKTKLTEVRDIYYPLLTQVKEGKIQGKAAVYVETKFQLLLNYCTNISFYMMLKSNQTPVQNHPVIKRLLQHRNLLKQLEPVCDRVKAEIDIIIDKLNKGEHIQYASPAAAQKSFIRRKPLRQNRERVERKKLSELVSDADSEPVSDPDNEMVSDEETELPSKKKRSLGDRYETQDEKDALEYYRMMKSGGNMEELSDNEEEENNMLNDEEMNSDDANDVDGKRAVTYQIEKNKNIQIKKKKEDRNPRVKLRNKYRKAKIRRKGQVREVRKELSRYGGEASGIRAGIKRSIKIKT